MAVVEHGRRGQGNVQIIEWMAPQVAIPGLPGSPRRGVGIAGIVTLGPELLSMVLGQLTALVCCTETERFLSFSLGHPPWALEAHEQSSRGRIIHRWALIAILEQTGTHTSL